MSIGFFNKISNNKMFLFSPDNQTVIADIKACMYTFADASIEDLDLTCDNLLLYVKCLIKAEGFAKKTSATESNLRLMTVRLNFVMEQNNLHCDLNLRAMVKNLQEAEELQEDDAGEYNQVREFP
jgi:hypothetical protein